MGVTELKQPLTTALLAKSRRTNTAGGHFDRVVFGDEMMVPESTLDARLSVMSLAVAADSGWYQVDFLKADPFIWGRDKGCSILDSQCPRNVISEFCSKIRQTSCSDDFKYISLCRRTRHTGPCMINMNHQNCKVRKKRSKRGFRYGRFSICQNCRVSFVAL